MDLLIDLSNYMYHRVSEVSGICAILDILQYIYYQLTIDSGAIVINIDKGDPIGVDGDFAPLQL